MARRNHRPDLNGVLVIDKPLGWTSAQVCGYIRRHSRGAKVGHAGTLDPLATGVLLVCLGTATKSVDRLMGAPKRYLAEVDLSCVSTTDDGEGEIREVAVASPPTVDDVRRACDALTGRIMQRPPAHSAIWVGGERAYHLARAGAAPELKPRPVEVHSIGLVAYNWPRVTLDILCGKGTYIRSLARDLGEALGTGGMLSALRRTAVGAFTDSQAITPEKLPAALRPEHLLPPPDPAARHGGQGTRAADGPAGGAASGPGSARSENPGAERAHTRNR